MLTLYFFLFKYRRYFLSVPSEANRGSTRLCLHQVKYCFNCDEYVAIVSELARPAAISSSKISCKSTVISSLFLSGTIALYISDHQPEAKCLIITNIRQLAKKIKPPLSSSYSITLIFSFQVPLILLGSIFFNFLATALFIPFYVLKLHQSHLLPAFPSRKNQGQAVSWQQLNLITRTFENGQMPKTPTSSWLPT